MALSPKNSVILLTALQGDISHPGFRPWALANLRDLLLSMWVISETERLGFDSSSGDRLAAGGGGLVFQLLEMVAFDRFLRRKKIFFFF